PELWIAALFAAIGGRGNWYRADAARPLARRRGHYRGGVSGRIGRAFGGAARSRGHASGAGAGLRHRLDDVARRKPDCPSDCGAAPAVTSTCACGVRTRPRGGFTAEARDESDAPILVKR